MPIDNVDLTTGLPVLSVVCAVYVFPQLLKVYKPDMDAAAIAA